ncbi:hypothetical protein TcasGA2_TC016336 [Tribolium castaneum]|uniref:Uncharacterized protein n=1 Tax=Tribolium castaneum TaxID=7070 RepID=D6WPE7_TRICA|nr:hypothetical protein TcasGA2_TC016336 [Tribolium castaneum]
MHPRKIVKNLQTPVRLHKFAGYKEAITKFDDDGEVGQVLYSRAVLCTLCIFRWRGWSMTRIKDAQRVGRMLLTRSVNRPFIRGKSHFTQFTFYYELIVRHENRSRLINNDLNINHEIVGHSFSDSYRGNDECNCHHVWWNGRSFKIVSSLDKFSFGDKKQVLLCRVTATLHFLVLIVVLIMLLTFTFAFKSGFV